MARTRTAAILLWVWLGCLLPTTDATQEHNDNEDDKVVHLSAFFDASRTPPAEYMSHENQNKRLLFQRRVQNDKQEAMTRRFLSSAASQESLSTVEDTIATKVEAIEVDDENSRKQHRNTRRGRHTRSSSVRRRKTQGEEEVVDRQTVLENPLKNFENRRDATGRVYRNYKHPAYHKVDHQKQNDKKEEPKKQDDRSDSVDYQSVAVPYSDDDGSTGNEDVDLPSYSDDDVKKSKDEDDDNPYGDVSVPYFADDDDNSNVGYGDVSVPNYGHGYDVGYEDVSVPASKGKGLHSKVGDDDDGGSSAKGKAGASKGGDDDDDGGGKGKGEKGNSGKKGEGEGIYYPNPKGDNNPHYPTTTPDSPCAGRPQCQCDGGSLPDGFEYEFAMVREEVGTPDPGTQFSIASTLGINGYVHDIIHSTGQTTYNQAPIGLFTGICTVTGYPSDLLCTYEIVLYTNTQNTQRNGNGGPSGFGGIVAHGPVSGRHNMAIVTGAEFDFDMYHRGSLALKQDPTSPVLYATLKLYG